MNVINQESKPKQMSPNRMHYLMEHQISTCRLLLQNATKLELLSNKTMSVIRHICAYKTMFLSYTPINGDKLFMRISSSLKVEGQGKVVSKIRAVSKNCKIGKPNRIEAAF